MPRSIRKEFPHIFIDWHPTLNDGANPSALRRTSRKKYWWKCHSKKCGCNWKATIYSRIHLGDVCPKCKERKNKKFTENSKEIKVILKKIKLLQEQTDSRLEGFISDKSTVTSRQRDSVFVRRKIDEINKLGLELRKIILNHKKKMIGYNKEHKLIKKTNKNE